jgi:hypothetical protein
MVIYKFIQGWLYLRIFVSSPESHESGNLSAIGRPVGGGGTLDLDTELLIIFYRSYHTNENDSPESSV